jgi:hypothetical protein
MAERYPVETLPEDDDNGTMPENVAELSDAVIGRRIISAGKETTEGRYWWKSEQFVITLDDGRRVKLADTSDCCAYTELREFLLHPEAVDHAILGVGTTGDYTTWHIYADFGDVMELTVGWSCGNPFWYGYGFVIVVEDLPKGADRG